MTSVVVPVKRFALGKSRLSSVLGERERARFATALFDHALDALSPLRDLATVVVVTDCSLVAARAEAAGAEALLSTQAGNIGDAVRLGIAHVAPRGPAIVLMSDLPLLHAGDLEALLTGLVDYDVVLAPDTRDEGTNALALARPLAMKTCFGTGDSFPRHLASASAALLRPGVVRTVGLAFDVDTPEDYARFLSLSASGPADERHEAAVDRR